MFTVKHITIDRNGTTSEVKRETLYAGVKQVHRLVADGYDHLVVQFFDTDKQFITLDSGIVYIVNENGKTVATYDQTDGDRD